MEAVPLDFTVAVAVEADWTLREHWGSLRRISPEEYVYALVLAAAKAESAEDQEQYARLFRSVRYQCIIVEDEASLMKESINIRETQLTVGTLA